MNQVLLLVAAIFLFLFINFFSNSGLNAHEL